jgi:hypothetical protein
MYQIRLMDHQSRGSMGQAPLVLKLLADDLRWRLASELRWGDRTVGELVERTGASQNLGWCASTARTLTGARPTMRSTLPRSKPPSAG